jgi:hypothetical protein
MPKAQFDIMSDPKIKVKKKSWCDKLASEIGT